VISLVRRSGWLVSACLVLGLLAGGSTGSLHSQDPLELLTTIDVGGQPSAIVVDCCDGRNDVIFYDSDRVRFLDGDTLTVIPQEHDLPTSAWEGWMVYDRYHHHTYVVTKHARETDLRVRWKELQVHAIASRSLLDTFSVNGIYNTAPQDPTDRFYGLAGLAFKQPVSEGDNPGRLIVDDTANGNIDVVDLNEAGTAAARRQRYSYRPSLCSESHCSWENVAGNSLALETRHETLPVDDLTTTDVLYVSDKNHADSYGLRALRLDHPLQDLNVFPLPDVDLQHQCGLGGCQGITMAGGRDVLYVASGDQGYERGYVDEVHTTTNGIAQVVELLYGDEDIVHVDWYDAKRVFVATFDHWGNYDPDQTLYLHLIYDGTVVDTLELMDGYDQYNGLRGMAFDPYHRRLYLTVVGSIMVVGVNYGQGPPLDYDERVYLPLLSRSQ
jgi:hypothetical protein